VKVAGSRKQDAEREEQRHVHAQKLEVELAKTLKELDALRKIQEENQDKIDQLRADLSAERSAK
jgi:gamma-glutamylcyclotransferase (GGCT)/AIG2-like uncharacterized protein YtfP